MKVGPKPPRPAPVVVTPHAEHSAHNAMHHLREGVVAVAAGALGLLATSCNTPHSTSMPTGMPTPNERMAKTRDTTAVDSSKTITWAQALLLSKNTVADTDLTRVCTSSLAPPLTLHNDSELALWHDANNALDTLHFKKPCVDQLRHVIALGGERMALLDSISLRTDLPRELIAAIWFRESASMRTDIYLDNGQSLGATTTIAPVGKYFGKDEFVDAAVDALQPFQGIQAALDLHTSSKDLAAMCVFAESYNGLGYTQKHGTPSPYVWAGTSRYHSGLYTSDGNFDSTKVDARPGALPVIVSMLDAHPR
jgi:lysozyme family protein